MRMNTNEWKQSEGVGGGSGLPVPMSEDAQQMPLGVNMDGGMGSFEGASVDAGPKRSINGFVMLVIVLAVGGGGLFVMRMSNLIGPADAAAQATEKKIDEALKRFATSKGDTAASAKAIMHDAEQILALLANDPVKSQVEVGELAKNPFELTANKPLVKDSEADTAAQSRAARRRQLEGELKGLKVQTVLSGSKPMAVISGKVLRLGDEVGSFVIDAIEPSGVRLKSGEDVFILSMPVPNAPQQDKTAKAKD